MTNTVASWHRVTLHVSLPGGLLTPSLELTLHTRGRYRRGESEADLAARQLRRLVTCGRIGGSAVLTASTIE